MEAWARHSDDPNMIARRRIPRRPKYDRRKVDTTRDHHNADDDDDHDDENDDDDEITPRNNCEHYHA